MYPRPTTPNYQEMSLALQQGIQEALLGTASPEDALHDGCRKQRSVIASSQPGGASAPPVFS